jgi:transcriptional antiterminator RfaH
MYWACAQLESNRTRLALHCLDKVAGYEIYNPQLREQRRVRGGRKIMGVAQLFPSYVFVLVVSAWYGARWSPGVVRLVMDGEHPAHVPDQVIAEIRSRERGGFVVLPKARGLALGTRMKVLQGPLQGQIGLLAALRPHERVVMLLQMLGGQQRVELSRSVIEAVE